MNSKIFLSSLVAALALGGCAIGPDYTKPEIPTPPTFRGYDQNLSQETKTGVDSKWWRGYGDERLTKAVEEALAASYDIKIASSQVDALLGQFDEAKSYLYPHINGSGSLTRQGVENSTNSNLKNGVTNTYAATLSMASYEIDLFGKVRRATEAARAMLLSGEYNRRAVNLSIAASTANAYFAVSSIEAQIAAAQDNLKASEEIEKISRIKYQNGSIGETEWLQSTAASAAARASLASLMGQKASAEATLNNLMGRNPQRVESSPIDSIAVVKVSAGAPSELLLRRPDVGGAEQNLIAANAKIGVARGAYFPSISLTGMLGNQSNELNKLFSSPTRIWQIAPAINIPIFSAGYIAGQVKEAEAGREQALAQYKKTVVAAFNDADSAIGQNYYAKEQYVFGKQREDAMKKAFEQAKLRYEVGSISYTDMLTVQQNYLSARQQAIIAKQAALSSGVALYKALGGGWDDKNLPDLPSFLPAGR